MFQTGSNITVNDNKSESLPPNEHINSFPRIQKKPSSRGEISKKKDLFKKQSINLPNMKLKNSNDKIKPKTDRYHEKQSSGTISKFFQQDIDDKLNFLIQADNNKETVEDGESLDSNDFDFELNIKKNKELIQGHKKEKQKIVLSKQALKKEKNIQSKQKIQKFIVKSPVEKRPINRILGKVKSTQNSKQKDQVRGSIHSMKPKFQKKSPRKPNLPPRIPKNAPPKSENKVILKKGKNESLFDNIQNFLQNPQQDRKKDEKMLIGLTLLKQKRDLEDKLKIVNEELQKKGQKIEQQTKITKPDQDNIKTNEWRRINLKDKGFDKTPSNFEGQMDRIANLQGKADQTLTEYVEYQQLLLQLSYQKKIIKK